MALSPRLLGADEHEVLTTRTHAKALTLPALALIFLGALIGGGAAMVPSDYRPAGQFAVLVLGAVLGLWWVVLPFLRWRTSTCTLTNRRLITSAGIVTKTGRDVPLARVHEVGLERSLTDRMFGCGSLLVQTAAEEGALRLVDLPEVELWHREINAVVLAAAPVPNQAWPPPAYWPPPGSAWPAPVSGDAARW